MPTLQEVVAAATAHRDAEKENTRRLPDIAERPPSPGKDDSTTQQPPPNVALGAL
ncbi:hypothetical protein FRC12_013167, partial [Ceratobasidium sp. 428]